MIKDCDYIRKRRLGPDRLRFTVKTEEAGAKVVALSDKTKSLAEYFDGEEVNLVFKDLGPQISWTTVFLVEYAGPIVITLVLWLARK